MSTQISKRALTAGLGAGLGAGALALLAQTQRASADTPFSSFGFPATGTSTPRTMPDRLSEIKNVKDFGAVGNGSVDDSAAIQAAINATSNSHRGTVFFPPGIYQVGSPLTFPSTGVEGSVNFVGSAGASQIRGGFAGFLLTIGSGTSSVSGRIDGLWFSNSSTNASAGCVRMLGCQGMVVQNCRFGAGMRGLQIGNNPDDGCFSNYVINCQFAGVESINSINEGIGSIGLVCGQHTFVYGSDFSAWTEGVRAFGIGVCLLGIRAERNKFGMMLGKAGDGTTIQLDGFLITSGSFESNIIGIYCLSLAVGEMTGLNIHGSSSLYQLDCGIHIQGATGTTFTGIGVSVAGSFINGGIRVVGPNYPTTFINCLASSWNIPSYAPISMICIGSNNPPIAVAFADLANLPAVAGTRQFIKNCGHATFGLAANGAGTNSVPVYYNGATWIVG